MPKISFANLSELEGAQRIDAEFYTTGSFLLEIIKKSGYEFVNLDKIAQKGYRAVYWNTQIIPRQNMRDDDVYFLQASDLSEDFPVIDANGMGGVWHQDWDSYPDGRVEIGELLIEVKGKAEKVALVPENFPKNTLVSGSLFKLSVKDVTPEYVLVYLLTRFGKGFRDRLKTNLLVSFVNKNDLYSIPIVKLPLEIREEVKRLYLAAYSSNEESEKSFSQAERLFSDELALHTLNLKPKLVYESDLKSVLTHHRLDAEYFQPKYSEIMAKIEDVADEKGWQAQPISEISEPLRYGTSEKLEYIDSGRPFLRITDVKHMDFDPDSLCRISEKKAKTLDYALVRENDLLISRSGTLGLTVTIPKELEDSVFGSYFIRIRPKKDSQFDSTYLAFYLNSVLGKTQVERFCSGSLQTNLTIPAIEKIKVLISPKQFRDQISALVKQSQKARRKSRFLLKSAIRKVEDIIENGKNEETSPQIT